MDLSIDWFITTKCNDTCKFCYAPLSFKEYELELKDYYNICNRIKELGFKKVTICGGEPTLNKHIVEIVEYLHGIGMKVVFYTNGINLDILKQVTGYIEFLSLPVDSVLLSDTKQQLTGLRSAEQMYNVFLALDFLEQLNTTNPLKVKIGTVVNRKNIGHLKDIYSRIRKYSVVRHWRLYQFSPGEKGRIYRNEYEISDEEFKRVQEEYQSLTDEGFSLSFRSKSDNIGYCIIMNQNGEIFKYNEEYQELHLNIFDKSLNDIIQSYDINRNIKQKRWINT